MKSYQICLDKSCQHHLVLQKDEPNSDCSNKSHQIIPASLFIENAESSIKVFHQALDLVQSSYISNEEPGRSNKAVQKIFEGITREIRQSIEYSKQAIKCIQEGIISKSFLMQLLHIDMEGQITNKQYERMMKLVQLFQLIYQQQGDSKNEFKCSDLIQLINIKHIQVLSIEIMQSDMTFTNRMRVYTFLPQIQTLQLSLLHYSLTEQENNTLCQFIALQPCLKRLSFQAMLQQNNYNHLKNIISSIIINTNISYLALDHHSGFLPLKIFSDLAHLIQNNKNIRELRLMFEFTRFNSTSSEDLINEMFQQLQLSKSIYYFYGYFNYLTISNIQEVSQQLSDILEKNSTIQEFCFETALAKYNLVKISQGLLKNVGLQYFNLTGSSDYQLYDMALLCKAAQERMQNSTLRSFSSYSYQIPLEQKPIFRVSSQYQNLRYQAMFYILAYQKHLAPYIIYNPNMQYIDLFVN